MKLMSFMTQERPFIYHQERKKKGTFYISSRKKKKKKSLVIEKRSVKHCEQFLHHLGIKMKNINKTNKGV